MLIRLGNRMTERLGQKDLLEKDAELTSGIAAFPPHLLKKVF